MTMAQPSKPSPMRAAHGEAEGAKISIDDMNGKAEDPRPSSPPANAGTDPVPSCAAPATKGNRDASAGGKTSPQGGPLDEVIEGEPIEAEPESEADRDAALEQARKESAEWQDKFLRLHAEWDTYRRRTIEQREAEKLRATEKLVTNLLPVIDDFERMIDYAVKNGEQHLVDGVRAVYAKLVDVLVKDGVSIIDPQGEAFDAIEAQAVATVENTKVPDETVADVYQKGYKMGEKVLRPAMVTVTSGGPKREKPQDGKQK